MYGDIIKNIVRTEKGAAVLTQNKYIFEVGSKANKIDIAKAVEGIYKVKVIKVNTMKVRGKKKRIRYKQGLTPDWKKVVVTLKSGDKIDIGV